ncbi:nuclease-like protein [Scopulibacillus darangshiensis]|uniref:Nuclease-like protein n=1 Tax=Scopulibacillus darangshiensis TaxID=442528 RepID=A0A4R2NE13_9BACL|nr:nuclease-related domain-containing protein [Scopulibacillus darangshiensis]TCP19519.1 nuclease-like protein [Scopulibacillus darangshiensis]
MIVKKRTVPLKILCNEALLRSIPPRHPKRSIIEMDLKNRRSGFQGEQSIDYYLHLLPESQYHIFHDLRLTVDGRFYFQIDNLLNSLNFHLIVEVKNYSGTILYDHKTNQFFQIVKGIKKSIDNPLSQVKRHKRQLKDWKSKHNFTNVPIEYLVVFGNPATILETTSDTTQVFKRIVRPEQLLDKIEEFEGLYPNQVLDNVKINDLDRQLLRAHTPPSIDIFQTYGMTSAELIIGVRCPACGSYPMNRENRKWLCPACGNISMDAHKRTILDYLLIHGTITNQQCRENLLLPTRNVAYKMLKSLNLPYTGVGTRRTYHLPPQAQLSTYLNKNGLV